MKPPCEFVAKVIRISPFTLVCTGVAIVRITFDPFAKRINSDTASRTPVLLRIARSSVDGSPILITFDTDLKVIRSSVNGV